MGVSDDVTDAGDIHLRKDCTAADETAVEEQIEGKEAEEFYDDQEPLTGTDVEILSRDENNENFAEYSSETEDEVKESADVGFAIGNTGAESDKAGEGTSLRVTRLSLPFGLGQLVSDWIGSPRGLLSLIRLPFSGNNVQVTNRSTQFGRGKAGDGMSLSGVDELFHCEDKVEKSADVGSESDKAGEGMFLHVEYSFLVKRTTGHEIKKSADGSTEVGRVEPGDEMSLSRNGVNKRSDVGIENGNDVGIGNGKAGDGMSLSGDEVKENADVGIENGNDEPGNRKTGDEMSLSEDVVKENANVGFGNGNTGAGSHKAVYAFCLVLFSAYGGKCWAANNSSDCRGILVESTTLEYGDIVSFTCPVSRENGLKLCADGHLAYSGYGLSKNYSWLQVECFNDGCNFTITAGVDTPRYFECLEAGSTHIRYFLIRSEPKVVDVENVSAGFTNTDLKTVSAGFANSGMENGARGFNFVTLMVVLAIVLAVPIILLLYVVLRRFLAGF